MPPTGWRGATQADAGRRFRSATYRPPCTACRAWPPHRSALLKSGAAYRSGLTCRSGSAWRAWHGRACWWQSATLASSIRSVAPGTVPAVNVGRTPTSVEIYAFAPGLDASKIDVTLDRGVLRISGERASGVPEGNAKVHVYTRERGTGSFTRAISLPDDVDPAHVNASYRDGVLQVSVARRESAQPKRVTVQ